MRKVACEVNSHATAEHRPSREKESEVSNSHISMSYSKNVPHSLDRQERNVPAISPAGNEPAQRWRALLHARGLSDSTIDQFNISPAHNSWQYPVHPDISEQRHKHTDSQASPKYWWDPKKPEIGTFYDP